MIPRGPKAALIVLATVTCTAPSTAAARIGTVDLDRSSWVWSSTPRWDGGAPPPGEYVFEHSRLEWYNPRGATERDLNPSLSDMEGGDHEHKVLELNVKPPTGSVQIQPFHWTGLTQPLSRIVEDYTRFQYLEIWVNDFMPYPGHVNVRGKLHIDLGLVSEDAFWDPEAVPNGRLDTEDKNGDGRLDRSSDLAFDEDTGLDGLHSVEEPGYTGGSSDPHQDDYDFDPERVPQDYSRINNMEGNGLGLPNALPDTEDLNRDGFADFFDAYYEATIDLADTSSYVATDVVRDYGPREQELEHPLSRINGWRRYRVPLSEEAFVRVRPSASLERVEHFRIWVNGMDGPLRLQIGGVEFLDAQGRPQPREPIVYQNAPNPFNPGTTIRFELPDPGTVRLRIYDVHGRLVRELMHESRPAGYHAVYWDGEDASARRVASGVYWYRMELPGVTPQTRKMVMAR